MQVLGSDVQNSPEGGQAFLTGLNSLSLELTNNCNLSCVHCYADSSPDEPLNAGMTLEDWKTAIRQAAALQCETVRFIGGEPTAYPGLGELVVFARAQGLKNVFLHTNGTRITESLRTILVRYSVGLAFSLYAGHAEAHDAVTKVPGSFLRTIASIRWAVSEGLNVQVSITRIADQNEIDAATSMVRRMGVTVVSCDRLRPFGRGGNSSASQDLNELCGSCWKGKLCVSASGSIHPCVFSRFQKVGSVSEGIAAAVESKALQSFRAQVRAIDGKRHAGGLTISDRSHFGCSPEEDPGPCNPERDPGKCNPEKDPGECNPEKDPGPCNPEKPS